MIRREAILLVGLATALPGCASGVDWSKPIRGDEIRFAEANEAELAIGQGPAPIAQELSLAARQEIAPPANAPRPEFVPAPAPSIAPSTPDIEGNQHTQTGPELGLPVPGGVGPGEPPTTPAGETPIGSEKLSLDEVLASVRQSYPLLRAAFESRDVAAGEQMAAWGEFDLKLKAGTMTQPLGYYDNYRYFGGFEQPTYWGGQAYAGYKLGRGSFEPWYKERETNQGGEFAAGLAVPFAQGREIDPRRAAVWNATYGRTLTEFEIQQQGIEFSLAAALAYWEWVAAGEIVRISEAVLALAEDRVDYLTRQIELQRLPPIALTDNQRLILSRQSKVILARQKLQQNAVKLSLFLRGPDGTPRIPTQEMLPDTLPTPTEFSTRQVETDVAVALSNRPELRQLMITRRQLEVDLALARNEIDPRIDGVLQASKDVGGPASSINDKGPFVLEAGLTLEVPIQRRKGRGKLTALEGKLTQNAEKQLYSQNKITSETQSIGVELSAAYEHYQRAYGAVDLNRKLEEAERRKLLLERGDLLLVNVREQATFDSEVDAVFAWLEYFQSQATRRAVLALDAGWFSNTTNLPADFAIPIEGVAP